METVTTKSKDIYAKLVVCSITLMMIIAVLGLVINFPQIAGSKVEDMTMKQAVSFIENKETGIIYFGFEDCPWCEDLSPRLNLAAVGQRVNYVNVRPKDIDLRKQDDQSFEWLKEYAQEFLPEVDGEVKMYVPFVMFIKDGALIDAHTGTLEGHDAKERELTTDESHELVSILKKKVEAIR